MKATDFVKKHGWEKVIEALKTTPKNYNFQSTDVDPILAKDGAVIGFNCKVHTISSAAVKLLVESYELVEECGGLTKAKERVSQEERLPNPNIFYVLVVSSAIDDVEACQ